MEQFTPLDLVLIMMQVCLLPSQHKEEESTILLIQMKRLVYLLTVFVCNMCYSRAYYLLIACVCGCL